MFHFNWDNCGFALSCSRVFRSTDLLTQTLPLVAFWEQELSIIQDLDSLPFHGLLPRFTVFLCTCYLWSVHWILYSTLLTFFQIYSGTLLQWRCWLSPCPMVHPTALITLSPLSACFSYPWQLLYYVPPPNSWMPFVLTNNGAQALILAKQTFYDQAVSPAPYFSHFAIPWSYYEWCHIVPLLSLIKNQ